MEKEYEEIEEPPPLSAFEVEKAIKYTYIQSVLSSIYLALTTGVFIVGFALELGANDAQIGLISSVPLFFVISQIFASWLVQRGVSRRRLTVGLQLLVAWSWFLVAAIPHLFKDVNQRIFFLIFILSASTFLNHIITNARSSWLADIVPPRMLGEFFGKIVKYGNIVVVISTVAGSSFLGHLKEGGTGTFTWVFAAAALVFTVNSLLYLPQADIPVKPRSFKVWQVVKASFRNRSLMSITIFATVWSLQIIAAPFVSAYQLRDLGAPFLGVAIVGAVPILIVVLTSSFWGRMVDRYGCRPVLVFSAAIAAPTPLVWIWVDKPEAIYYLLAPVFVIGGLAGSGVMVALSALIFNAAPKEGRTVYLAVYSIIVTVLAAPMPALGGYLPKWLAAMGIHTDLRCTFYAAMFFLIMAFFMARRIHEPDSSSTSVMMRDMPVVSTIRSRKRGDDRTK